MAWSGHNGTPTVRACSHHDSVKVVASADGSFVCAARIHPTAKAAPASTATHGEPGLPSLGTGHPGERPTTPLEGDGDHDEAHPHQPESVGVDQRHRGDSRDDQQASARHDVVSAVQKTQQGRPEGEARDDVETVGSRDAGGVHDRGGRCHEQAEQRPARPRPGPDGDSPQAEHARAQRRRDDPHRRQCRVSVEHGARIADQHVEQPGCSEPPRWPRGPCSRPRRHRHCSSRGRCSGGSRSAGLVAATMSCGTGISPPRPSSASTSSWE